MRVSTAARYRAAIYLPERPADRGENLYWQAPADIAAA